MPSETASGSADGSAEGTQSAVEEGPCARRHGHGGRGRARRLADGRLYRGTPSPAPASSLSGRRPRESRFGSRIGGGPRSRPVVAVCHRRRDYRSHLFSSACRRRRPSFVCHRRDKLAACPALRRPAGPWGRRARLGLRCVCGRLCRRDDCGTCLRRRSHGTF